MLTHLKSNRILFMQHKSIFLYQMQKTFSSSNASSDNGI